MASAAVLRRLLERTSVPEDLVEEFLAETNALWLLAERDDVVAGEMVLCHPPLEAGEVRAVVKGTDRAGAWRITVVTADRPGLLASTAAVLANDGLGVTNAAITVLDTSRLALQRVTVSGPVAATEVDWDRLGERLRSDLLAGRTVRVPWRASDPVIVECHPQGSGRAMVQVEAPDTIGLLCAIAGQLNEQGVNIEAARLSSEEGMAKDAFIVEGTVNTERLLEALSVTGAKSAPPSRLGKVLTAPLAAASGGLRWGADALRRLRSDRHSR